MEKQPFCDVCGANRVPSREDTYRMESLEYCDDDYQTELSRQTNPYDVDPMRLCKDCYASVMANHEERRKHDEAIGNDQKRFNSIAGGALAVLGALLLISLVYDLLN